MIKIKSNKRKLVLVFAVIILIIALCAGTLIYHNSLQGERPFEDLTAEDVKSISLYSQNVTQEIIYTFTDEESEEIIKHLNRIVIGEKDNQEYVGGFDPEFRMEMNDGKVIEFSVNANFWFDGQRYEVVEGKQSLFKINDIHTEYYREYYVPFNAQS